MLDKLAIFNEGNFKSKVGQMVMFEDMVKERLGPFGMGNRVEFLMRKQNVFKYLSKYNADTIINDWSEYCLKKLLKHYGYFKLNDEIELRRWDLYED